jgi:hypothetical protein
MPSGRDLIGTKPGVASTLCASPFWHSQIGEAYPDSVFRIVRTTLPALACATILIAGCALDADQSVDFHKWQREDTIWENASGSKVVRYTYGLAVGKDDEAIVCEQRDRKSSVIRLPADTSDLVSGGELKVVRTSNWTLPGWYRIWRTPGLDWWQRTFSDKPLGGAEFIKDQGSLQKPPQDVSRNAVLTLSAGKWQKVADEKEIRDLFEVPAEGMVYVGEPGIGVLKTIDLPSACR